MRPSLPDADELAPYLRRIDEARWYTNFGPLMLELEGRLAQLFRVPPQQLALVGNGTIALSALLSASGAPAGSRCLIPSWTFVASAAAAWAANLVPHFVDVDPQTWMPDPDRLARRHDMRDVGAVMVVSPFGAPVDMASWNTFTERTGVPVIVDGAAAFDTMRSVATAAPDRSPAMISLHATKVFGVGEGAIVVSTDEPFVHRVRQICNFGVWGSPEGQVLGYNGKLSEFHAAVGLANLARWPAQRARFEALTHRYRDALGAIPGVSLLPRYGEGWVSCYCNVAVDGAAEVIRRLDAAGIETRRWWRAGVHAQTAYRGFGRDDLPETERLAARVFGLPFYSDMQKDAVERVTTALADALTTI